jgi:hypothetical protein
LVSIELAGAKLNQDALAGAGQAQMQPMCATQKNRIRFHPRRFFP